MINRSLFRFHLSCCRPTFSISMAHGCAKQFQSESHPFVNNDNVWAVIWNISSCFTLPLKTLVPTHDRQSHVAILIHSAHCTFDWALCIRCPNFTCALVRERGRARERQRAWLYVCGYNSMNLKSWLVSRHNFSSPLLTRFRAPLFLTARSVLFRCWGLRMRIGRLCACV